MGAVPITASMVHNSLVDGLKVDDMILGCANHAGEDNRNVIRMSTVTSVSHLSNIEQPEDFKPI